MQSDPDDEFQEMLLKAAALVKAIALSTGPARRRSSTPTRPKKGARMLAHA